MALPRPGGGPSFSRASARKHPGLSLISTATKLPEAKNLQKSKIFQHRKTPLLHFSMGGRLSSWPAYASAQAILQTQKPCSAINATGAKDKADHTIAKPRYLQQLENYLRKELLILDMTKANAQELKLQPYREVFEFFIEDFKTYKPLLSSIKNEYEVTLAHLKEKIRALEPLKAMLVNISEDCNEKILAIKAEERYEIKMLKKEKINLLKLIDKKNEEKISLQTQVAKLRKNLAEEYLHFLNERDARRILIADLNELRYQREDMSLAQSPGVWGEDPVKLTLALKMARQDLTKTQMELNTMKANFGDVVPRRDFEMEEKKNKALFEMMEHLKSDFGEIRKEYDMLLQVHAAIVKDRDDFYNELQEILRTSTPRPNWSKCEAVISGGQERWEVLSQGKTSDQLVDVLLEEIGSGLLQERDTFQGLGFGEDVPVFLRTAGFVRNKKLSKKEVVDLIKDVWKDRIAQDQKERLVPLSEFFLSYLTKRFGEASAMDWSYTIFEHIKLFHSIELMKQFYDILTGKLDENVFHDQKDLMFYVMKELISADVQNEGALTMDQFSQALREAFPLKGEEEIKELTESAMTQLEDISPDFIHYRLLFSEDEVGNSGLFIQKLWEQAQSEKEAYLADLKTELESNKTAEITPAILHQALVNIDPTMDDFTLDSYVTQAFKTPVAELDPEYAEKLETLLENLQTSAIRRIGPREPEFIA